MRRGKARFTVPVWAGFLWGMALLGLLLLPAEYRAGAETAHGHALVQLWADAADGAIHHHHEPGPLVAQHGAAWDWLDPAVQDVPESTPGELGGFWTDVADHQDSTPVGGGVHLLVKAVAPLVLAAARCVPATASSHRPASQVSRVLLPPPRWTPVAG